MGRSWLDAEPAAFDTSIAHHARIYDYLLSGKDNYAADRKAGDALKAAYPAMVELARANRAFLGRAVRFLAGAAGIRQFLDIGAGIPAAGNTHQIAQEVAPDSRVVYVDYDPVVLPMPARCWPAARTAPPTTLTPMRATSARSWSRPHARWTSPSRWRRSAC
jgi:hypothetical protein